MNNRFTLYYSIASMAEQFIKSEKHKKGSIVGNLIKYIERNNKLRDAQRLAIEIYLWLKEKGNNQKLSTLIKDGKIFESNTANILYPSDSLYFDKPSLRYLNRYFQDIGIRNKEELLGSNVDYKEFNQFIEDLFEDFDYPNYLFSLPMGSGKTFLMAIFIYIDIYMYEKTHNNSYASNFIIIAPSARKTAILPALKTIRLFNPKWILPSVDAERIKRNLKIEVLDEIPNSDKLQNQNPNLAKISRTVNGHPYGNVFILNAEKVIPNSDLSESEMDSLSQAVQTKIKKANQIKKALSNLSNIEVFLDEAHHTYSNANDTKKLREQLKVINEKNNIKCCIGMSGTPYIDRQVVFNNKSIKLQDIQDIVYFYPLTLAIGNFLKRPVIKKVDGSTELLINKALEDFFNNYDIKYDNGTVSKIAFYCSSIEKLNTEILPLINRWYEDNNRNKSEILKYYTNTSDAKKYPIPKENLTHFLNLDNPTSKYRVVLLVSVGTEGWDCRSLTSVVLPRQNTSKNFVLQTTCRCLREVSRAQYEKALIYLDNSNYETLDNELKANYHLHITDITSTDRNFKDYPVYSINNTVGKINYKNIYEKYIEMDVIEDNIDVRDKLLKYDFNNFKKLYPYTNQIGTTEISDEGLDRRIIFNNILNDEEYDYDFIDFLYELENASFGYKTCSELISYKDELEKIYNQISSNKNMSWIINHPVISTYDVCKNIVSLFSKKVKCKKEIITEDVEMSILDWNLNNKPVIRIFEDNKNNVYPENSYDDIEGTPNYYDEDIQELKRRYETKMRIPNKEKSFNYLPYRMDSSYEYNFLQKVLQNITEFNIEVYYNGYKNNDLNSVKIITPYGRYTPDFVVIKRKENMIKKILLVETKAEPYETEAKEKYVKEQFINNNPQFDYIRIGDIANDVNEYNKLIDVINNF